MVQMIDVVHENVASEITQTPSSCGISSAVEVSFNFILFHLITTVFFLSYIYYVAWLILSWHHLVTWSMTMTLCQGSVSHHKYISHTISCMARFLTLFLPATKDCSWKTLIIRNFNYSSLHKIDISFFSTTAVKYSMVPIRDHALFPHIVQSEPQI